MSAKIASGQGDRAKTTAAARAAAATIKRFGQQVCEQAVCLRTAVPSRVQLADVGLPVVVRRFIERYDKTAAEEGLYTHQADVLRPLSTGEMHDTLLTSATGSGKSLALWGFLVQAMTALHDATALACFPTQALLWGQVERLRRASEPASLVGYAGQTYAGMIKLGPVSIPWTAWHGVSDSATMARHEQTDSFRQARLRIATVDKVHWSLMKQEQAYFLSKLSALAIDEAHAWHGAVGASVRCMLNRLHAALELHRKGRPALFLASATLAEPVAFAAQLTGRKALDFRHVHDGGATQAFDVPAAELPKLIGQATEEAALLRFVLLLSPFPKKVSAQALLEDDAIVDDPVKALCFVQSKFLGHRLGVDLAQRSSSRRTLVYDGDLPAEERRRIEQQVLQDVLPGKTIIGTSALELGIDLPDLDLVVMDQLPLRRHELLQRLGRVGRRVGAPGLGILCLDHSPVAQSLTDCPSNVLSPASIPGVSLPLHLDHIRLRAMTALFSEWSWSIKRRDVREQDVENALAHHFCEQVTRKNVECRVEECLGALVDRRDESWIYQGFRPSLTHGKHPLVLRDTQQRVALIDGAMIYRDAHPEGVYLGHQGERYRVVRYQKRSARKGSSTSVSSSAAFLDSLDHIVVESEARSVATRGKWREQVRLVEKLQPARSIGAKLASPIEYGKWEWRRRFDGYEEFDLTGKQHPKEVSLQEVVQRYRTAQETGESMPFLPEQTYQTLGWRCSLGDTLPGGPLGAALAVALTALLGAHFCAAAECSPDDLYTLILPKAAELRVLDRAPGGSGLSEALLRPACLIAVLGQAGQEARRFVGQPEDWFFTFLNERGRCPIAVSPDDVADALHQIGQRLTVSRTT